MTLPFTRLITPLITLSITLLITPLITPLALAQTTRPAPKSAKEVWDRHVKAIGQDPHVYKPSRMVMSTSVPMAGGANSKMEMYTSPPNKFYIKSEMPGIGIIHTGYDGTTAWAMSDMTGPMLLPEEQAKELAERTRGQAGAGIDTSMKLRGETKIDGRRTWVVEGGGLDSAKFAQYFDDESGLMIGMDAGNYTTPGKPMVAFRDYKRFGGVMMATLIVSRMPTGDSVIARLVEYEQKAQPDSLFVLPAAVKALLAKSPAGKP